MGNRWGQEKRMGKERGSWRSVYKQPGTRVDRDRTTRKGGIPSKLEGLGNRGGILQAKGEITKGDRQGVIKGFVPCALI
jgi:hypothetical protein